MAQVVVVLLRQYDEQFKIEFSWMEVHILLLVTNSTLSLKCKSRRVGPYFVCLGDCGLVSLPLTWQNAKC
jgi:hypothetical protein